MMQYSLLLAAAAAVSALPQSTVTQVTGKSAAAQWTQAQFKNLIAFGDSYTDESRLGYFINHHGQPPPVGYLGPESLDASDGGRIWARYVVQYTQQNTQLYNYAVSGAVCSNEITPRYFAYAGIDFPDLNGYEVPAFLADKKNDTNSATGKKLFTTNINKDNTVYAIWDGTNDLGYYAFVDDEEVPGATLTDYMDCIFNQVDQLYAHGGRYFVLMDIVPLYLAGEYANASFDGAGPNQYWPDKPTTNLTAISERMRLEVNTVNAIYQYRTPFELLVADRYPGANFALYDTYSLFLDIHNNPTKFLNGTTPLMVNGYYHHCSVTGGSCNATGDPDSYMWYDELHPSEQTQRWVAKEFVKTINGKGDYATYYSQ